MVMIFGIDPNAIANPDFVGLADQQFRSTLHKTQLALKFGRLPEIIGIEKGDIPTPTQLQTPVAGIADAPIARQHQNPDSRAEPGSQIIIGAVRGTVVNDDNLFRRPALVEH